MLKRRVNPSSLAAPIRSSTSALAFNSLVPRTASYASGSEVSKVSERSHPPSRVARSRDPLSDWFFSDFPVTPRNTFWDVNEWPGMTDLLENTRSTKWRPKVDIHETDKLITVTAEVPGMKKEELKVDIKEGALTIKGEKTLEKKEEEDKYTRIERSYGAFQRRISLPDNADPSQIKATYDAGVLTISIPKQEKAEGSLAVKID